MKKSNRIRLWLWIVILITLGFALLTQCSLSKPKRIEHIVADCTKNIPFFPSWVEDLKRYGIHDEPESGLPEYYCRCTLGEPLQQMSEKDIQNLPNMSVDERLEMFGGKAALDQKHEGCLKAWKEGHP